MMDCTSIHAFTNLLDLESYVRTNDTHLAHYWAQREPRIVQLRLYALKHPVSTARRQLARAIELTAFPTDDHPNVLARAGKFLTWSDRFMANHFIDLTFAAGAALEAEARAATDSATEMAKMLIASSPRPGKWAIRLLEGGEL